MGLTNVSRTEIIYEPVSLETFGKMYDEPKGFGPLLASMYQAGAMGLLDQQSTDIEQLTGFKYRNDTFCNICSRNIVDFPITYWIN